MNIDIIAVGKIKERFFRDALDEYSMRLSRFVKLNITEVADERIPDNASEKVMESIKNKEGERILSKLKSGFVIALCIEGRELSSEELAAGLSHMYQLHSRITFIIGGSLGLSDSVKRRADMCLSFGKPTYPHQLMRVILAEQLYRAQKIMNNETYHK